MRTPYRGAQLAIGQLLGLSNGSAPAFADALFQELAEVEVPECKEETPVDTGDLQSTIRAVGPEIRGSKIKAGVAAGDALTDEYALPVHEDPEAFHETGGWKYIERPMRESAPHLSARVAKRVNLGKRVK